MPELNRSPTRGCRVASRPGLVRDREWVDNHATRLGSCSEVFLLCNPRLVLLCSPEEKLVELRESTKGLCVTSVVLRSTMYPAPSSTAAGAGMKSEGTNLKDRDVYRALVVTSNYQSVHAQLRRCVLNLFFFHSNGRRSSNVAPSCSGWSTR